MLKLTGGFSIFMARVIVYSLWLIYHKKNDGATGHEKNRFLADTAILLGSWGIFETFGASLGHLLQIKGRN